MLQLLKIEWMKMKRYNAFILISIFFIIGLFGSNYIVYAFKKHVVDGSDPTGIIASRSIFSFPTVWQTVSYFGGITLILPALLLLILVTNEYAFRTNRQNIIDGISRQSFIQVKLMLTLIIAVISTAITVLVAILFGKLVGGDFSFEGFDSIGYFFIKALTYNVFAIYMAVLIRKTGLTVALFFIYTVFENGLSVFLYVMVGIIKKKHDLDLTNIGNYLPMNASDGLLNSPFDSLRKMAEKGLPAENYHLEFGLSVFYLALFCLLSVRKVSKSDL